jgi:hypothetical protein
MRNLDADEFFENFLISAVAAILSIRVFLHLAGYPTVGGESLHIAHMLWGGLGLLVALLLLLGFLGKRVKSAAAVIGGAGWGTFIDELGKFLTHDNNYFFEPTFALIYVSFVVMYVAWERLHSRSMTHQEILANTLELMLEAVRKDMDAEERRRALDLLARADPDDPVAQSIARAVHEVELVPASRPGLMYRARSAARAFYAWLVRRAWFPTAVMAFFVIHSVTVVIQRMIVVNQLIVSLAVVAFGLLLAGVLLHPHSSARVTRLSKPAAVAVVAVAIVAGATIGQHTTSQLSFFEWGDLISAVVPALFVLLGVFRMRRSRLEAYRTFKTAVLIIIFVTQFFAFYHQQLIAVFGLLVNIVVWVTLRSMIQQEERLVRTAAGAALAKPVGHELHGEE